METKLTKAFKALRNAGYFAKQNFWCCQNCALHDIPDDVTKYVFYHKQDNTDKIKGEPFYVSWGGDANEICRIFTECGITSNWNGLETTRIQLSNYN